MSLTFDEIVAEERLAPQWDAFAHAGISVLRHHMGWV